MGVFGTHAARAQLDATQWKLGTVDIDQGWKEQAGDNPAWAQPNFDDSQWKTVELDDMGAAQPEWRWFRLRIKLAQGHRHVHLLFAGGVGAYQLYINGEKADGPEVLPFFEVWRPTEQVIPVPNEVTDLALAQENRGRSVQSTVSAHGCLCGIPFRGCAVVSGRNRRRCRERTGSRRTAGRRVIARMPLHGDRAQITRRSGAG
jgi:hypothetical protein